MATEHLYDHLIESLNLSFIEITMLLEQKNTFMTSWHLK